MRDNKMFILVPSCRGKEGEQRILNRNFFGIDGGGNTPINPNTTKELDSCLPGSNDVEYLYLSVRQ